VHSFEADMSYQGQSHTVAVALDDGLKIDINILRAAFEERYQAVYGRLLNDIPVRLLNLRVTAVAHREAFDFSRLAPPTEARLEDARLGSRQVWTNNAWRDTAVYDRLALPVGAIVPGPAVLEQPDGTVFVDAGLTGEVDSFGNLIMAPNDQTGKTT
jgi:N-methylhydantoinase A